MITFCAKLLSIKYATKWRPIKPHPKTHFFNFSVINLRYIFCVYRIPYSK